MTENTYDIKVKGRNVKFEERLRKCGSGSCYHLGEWPFGQEEKGMTEDEMVGWHHRLNGHRFWWTPGVGAGQGGLACCDSWGLKELDTTEQLD